MIAGLDSAFAPPASVIAAEYALGRRVWAGYFAGQGIYNGWSLADFNRIKAGGMSTLAYCSGWEDPAAMRAKSDSWKVPIAVDVESNIRPDGTWVPGWCALASSGLYGNGSVHYDSRGIIAAAFHIFSGYYGYDPQDTWPGWDARPNSPCGWQWAGTHAEFGFGVDSCWFDNAFVSVFGAGGGTIGADLTANESLQLALMYKAMFGDGSGPGGYQIENGALYKAIVAALPAGGGGTEPPEPAEPKTLTIDIPAQQLKGNLT